MVDQAKAVDLTTGSPFHDTIVDSDPPSAKVIDWFLSNANLKSPQSFLHPLGYTADTAAQGNHTHNGKDSPWLFDSTPIINTLTASSTQAQIITAVQQITQHLQSRGAGQSAT
jgi:hypothetical protein